MAKMKDLTGKQFGRLTVIRNTEKQKDQATVWECKCACGNTAFVRCDALTTGKTRSCGCLQRELLQNKRRDISGMRFGRLTAIRPVEQRRGTRVMWECICDCGRMKLVDVSSLSTGVIKSCGCLNKERLAGRSLNLSGQRFGNLIAVKPTEMRRNSSVVWECICDCGNHKFVTASQLCAGQVKSCGCLRKTQKTK